MADCDMDGALLYAAFSAFEKAPQVPGYPDLPKILMSVFIVLVAFFGSWHLHYCHGRLTAKESCARKLRQSTRRTSLMSIKKNRYWMMRNGAVSYDGTRT